MMTTPMLVPTERLGRVKAWVLDEVGSPLRLTDVEAPSPGAGQVVVRVKASGLCHSDVGYMHGVIPITQPMPAILGHEVAGVITAVGAGVADFVAGDPVVSTGTAADFPGVSRAGAYAEYVVLTAANLVRVPDGLDWAQAAAATDAGITSYTGVVVDGGVAAGDRVAIVGLGGLGMTGARIAVLQGATVYGVEPRKETWPIAKENGLTDVFADVEELAGMDLDVIVDFAGFGTTTAGAIRAVKPGGLVVLVGLGKTEWTMHSMDLVVRKVRLHGSTTAGNPAHLQGVIDLMTSGDLKIRAESLTFDEIPEGLARLERGEVNGRLVAQLDDA